MYSKTLAGRRKEFGLLRAAVGLVYYIPALRYEYSHTKKKKEIFQ